MFPKIIKMSNKERTIINYKRNIELGIIRLLNQHTTDQVLTKLQNSVNTARDRYKERADRTPEIVKVYIEHTEHRIQTIKDYKNVGNKTTIKVAMFTERIDQNWSLDYHDKYLSIKKKYHDVS